MAITQMDYTGAGGSAKKVTGSWNVINGTSNQTVSDLTNISCIEFAEHGSPQYGGTAVVTELNSVSLISVFSNNGSISQTLGITAISGNTVTFKYDGSKTIDYIAYGE